MSPKIFGICLLMAAALAGCTAEPIQQQATKVVVTGEDNSADNSVLIASQPSDAKIILKGAHVGNTPMKLLVRGDTNVVLEKEGFVKQALLITPKSDPNLVVQLVPLGKDATEEDTATEEEAPADLGETAVAVASGTKKKKKKSSSKTEDKKEVEKPPEETPPPAVEPEPEPEPKPATPKKKVYTTMRQLKDDLKKGIITKATYRKWQGEIRKKRAKDIAELEKQYRDGKFTKSEFKKKVREIKLKYEG